LFMWKLKELRKTVNNSQLTINKKEK
jgi:hypothetical protein